MPERTVEDRLREEYFDLLPDIRKVGRESNKIAGEYQIVSMLTGLFWEVEHSALYKPAPQLRGVARSLEMRESSEKVHIALNNFAMEFERLIGDYKNRKKKKK
jgi:hypothetical protein